MVGVVCTGGLQGAPARRTGKSTPRKCAGGDAAAYRCGVRVPVCGYARGSAPSTRPRRCDRVAKLQRILWLNCDQYSSNEKVMIFGHSFHEIVLYLDVALFVAYFIFAGFKLLKRIWSER